MGSFGLAMVQIAVAVTFSWAAAAKLTSPNEFRRTLDESAMPRTVSHLAVIGVPSAEARIGTAAVLTRGPVLGAVLTSAAFLVVAFSIWAVGVIRAGREVSCGCFGRREGVVSWRTVARNSIFATVCSCGALVAFVWRDGSQQVSPSLALAGVGGVATLMLVSAAWSVLPALQLSTADSQAK